MKRILAVALVALVLSGPVQAAGITGQYVEARTCDIWALLQAAGAKIETRCLGKHDTVCGNESAYYPPLVKGGQVKAAVASENSYKGKGIAETWKEHGRRAAYVGTFTVR